MTEPAIGTVGRPLYFFHIPKTAGSSINRLVNDAFPHDAIYPAYIPSVGCEPDLRDGWGVYRGHLGTLPVISTDRPMVVVTVLRDPAERAWSHYRFIRWKHADFIGDRSDSYTFDDFLSDPVWEGPGTEYQARWLAHDPDPRLYVDHAPDLVNYDNPLVHRTPADPPQGPALEGAQRMLDRCALVGTADRTDDFIDALSRLLGRRLPRLMRINVNPSKAPPPPDSAAAVRAASPTDIALLERADAMLDEALRTLPPLPPLPEPVDGAAVRFTQTMADPFVGSGWHARLSGAEAGWHRWSGPGPTSRIELAIRVSGRVRLEVDVISASLPATLARLSLAVQGKPASYRYEERQVGRTLVATFDADPSRLVDVTFIVERTAHLQAPDGSRSPDPAGIAVGDIRLLPPV